MLKNLRNFGIEMTKGHLGGKSIFFKVSKSTFFAEIKKTSLDQMLEKIFRGHESDPHNFLKRSLTNRGNKSSVWLAVYSAYALGLDLSQVAMNVAKNSPTNFIQDNISRGYKSHTSVLTEEPLSMNLDIVVYFDDDKTMNNSLFIKGKEIIFHRLN